MNKYSIVVIVPASIRDAVNAAAEANGHGPNNLSVPLSEDGSTITHYGTRTWATDSFLAEIDSYPAQLKDAAIIDIRGNDERDGHFDAVLAANNLVRVEEV